MVSGMNLMFPCQLIDELARIGCLKDLKFELAGELTKLLIPGVLP